MDHPQLPSGEGEVVDGEYVGQVEDGRHAYRYPGGNPPKLSVDDLLREPNLITKLYFEGTEWGHWSPFTTGAGHNGLSWEEWEEFQKDQKVFKITVNNSWLRGASRQDMRDLMAAIAMIKDLAGR